MSDENIVSKKLTEIKNALDSITGGSSKSLIEAVETTITVLNEWKKKKEQAEKDLNDKQGELEKLKKEHQEISDVIFGKNKG